MRILVAAFLVTTGCVAEPGSGGTEGPPIAIPAALADLDDVGIDLFETPPVGGSTSHHLFVRVTHGTNVWCPVIEADATLSIAGVAFKLVTRGAYTEVSTPDGPVLHCESPTFIGDVPGNAIAPTSVELADRTFAATFELGDLFAPRRASPIDSPDWAFRGGGDIAIAWTPASDLAAANQRVDARLVDPQRRTLALGAMVQGDGVHLRVPPGVTASGDLTLSLTTLGKCGPGCWYSVVQRVTHAATIAP